MSHAREALRPYELFVSYQVAESGLFKRAHLAHKSPLRFFPDLRI